MPDLTSQQTCELSKKLVYSVVADAMTEEGLTQVGTDRGYADLLDFYIAGRCGVLGDVDADVVAAAFGFFQPDQLRAVWERVLRVGPAREAARLYGPALAAYGAAALEGFDEGTRLAELLERVVDAAGPCALPLFAGWRAEPRPDEPRARACHAMHLLREWRGGAHVAAVTALGIAPLDAVVLNGGSMYAEFYQWPKPWGDGGGSESALAQAEVLTDGQCAPVFERALMANERGELVDLLGQAASVGSGSRAARTDAPEARPTSSPPREARR